ncbi:hypothetical protein [Desulfosporosinus sp. OT]|uniref:hypothetical protein n=1 Tax=Desulfosporosinus sp. OT TaxID=913865 RepID=UPI000223A06D|nr:hypothetical protein [Desulfosporosinus sp. OT]EGW37170.1 hypothetical protein DOT_4709 [Desulfosporosinus sp. OT]
MRGLETDKVLYKQFKDGALTDLLEMIKNNSDKYYLGIRDEYVNIYYMGGNLLKISCTHQNQLRFDFDEKYLVNSGELIPQKNAPVKEWMNIIPKLELYVKKYQNGSNPRNKIKKEKIAQQAILLKNNSCSDSDYFITDMEYSTPGIGFGRFDYIAIHKGKGNCRHRLALIELKYGRSAFGTNLTKVNDTNRYGSGIVGHSHNFYKDK